MPKSYGAVEDTPLQSLRGSVIPPIQLTPILEKTMNDLVINALDNLVWSGARGLSMIHRIIDGNDDVRFVKTPYQRLWEEVESEDYALPKWLQETSGNYNIGMQVWRDCLADYEIMTGEPHKLDAIFQLLENSPDNIKAGDVTPFTGSMPSPYKVSLCALGLPIERDLESVEFMKSLGWIAPR